MLSFPYFRMRINLIFAVCITIAKCKPSLNRSEKIRLRYGQYANITAAELSIAEEARIVGVKEEKHFEQCTSASFIRKKVVDTIQFSQFSLLTFIIK